MQCALMKDVNEDDNEDHNIWELVSNQKWNVAHGHGLKSPVDFRLVYKRLEIF